MAQVVSVDSSTGIFEQRSDTERSEKKEGDNADGARTNLMDVPPATTGGRHKKLDTRFFHRRRSEPARAVSAFTRKPVRPVRARSAPCAPGCLHTACDVCDRGPFISARIQIYLRHVAILSARRVARPTAHAYLIPNVIYSKRRRENPAPQRAGPAHLRHSRLAQGHEKRGNSEMDDRRDSGPLAARSIRNAIHSAMRNKNTHTPECSTLHVTGTCYASASSRS
ncbi:hypothetical protein EVAR_60918_1 [Eumeta japonica]|uniref:Uncharacterized protein n=1 Tax=Eumeta variegata TaxID=151549 RepID=A0A4C1ZED1_EUMVA|nr:hypothetical protein EVAR_60918_1 [Eumeta japonica]